jgi:hypothetical protein
MEIIYLCIQASQNQLTYILLEKEQNGFRTFMDAQSTSGSP